MFNYPGEYVQLPLGVCSTTLGSMFSHPGEYVQLPRSMFNYPGKYGQLPRGVCSATLVELGVSVEFGDVGRIAF